MILPELEGNEGVSLWLESVVEDRSQLVCAFVSMVMTRWVP